MLLESAAAAANKSTAAKVDCAKECPCGVPVIPVPDQWLEVMVTGGFKVWHIMFIIIAFVVTVLVVYCCFHRCRIPRTKQEIEADLIKINMTNKFRDYIQSMSKEPSNFLEALRRVQELEEKSEQDDAQLAREAAGRKRLGWLNLKSKGNGKEAPPVTNEQVAEPEASVEPNELAKPPAPAESEAPAEQRAAAEPEPEPAATEPARRPVRRRRQKPNLSRTKRPRQPSGDRVKSELTETSCLPRA